MSQISRRNFMRGSAAGMAALAAASLMSDQVVKAEGEEAAMMDAARHSMVFKLDEPVVTVEGGMLRGYIDDGIYTFKGIPYATAGRFEEPKKVEPWEGISNAVIYADIPPQTPMTAGGGEMVNPHFFWPQTSDETKIQALNIWTKSVDPEAKMPVMVWIHGGGFSTGSSIEMPVYDGHNLADLGDVVLVSINHRLNCLGYLDLSACGEEYKHSGNLGQMDIVAALEWVQANIAQFGGDPENVTLFGQSGGGRKILELLGTPSANGLFHKVICESCGKQSIPQENAALVGTYTLEELGLSSVDELKEVPYTDLLAAATAALAKANEELGLNMAWSPVIDGDFLPVEVWDDGMLADTAMDIPMIIGNVFGETKAFGMLFGPQVDIAALTDEEIDARLEASYGEKKDAVVEAFKKAYPDKNLYAANFVDVTSYRSWELPVMQAKAAQGGAPVWNYIFAYDFPTLGGWLPWHCSEIGFVFHNIDMIPLTVGTAEEGYKLEEEMSKAWISFAHTGDPNHDGLIEWPAYTNEEGAAMIFCGNSYVGYHHDAELIEAITG